MVGNAVFGIREPTEEVLRTVVEGFLDEVMTEAVVGFAVSVDESRSFTVENLAHDDVAGLFIVATHYGAPVAPTNGFCTHSGGVIMR